MRQKNLIEMAGNLEAQKAGGVMQAMFALKKVAAETISKPRTDERRETGAV